MRSARVLLLLAVIALTLATANSASEECGLNEHFNDCAPTYQLYCYSKGEIDTGHCVEACVCDQGFIREHPGGPCITKDKCPPL
ncbi:chymotrypsin inhibitor-like [Anopheles stephensi]|uniref:chymotrypsin inhibitor-like n=1 Tax=Anopheles stephensi TaxID=30069 RepID=UPI00165895C6|nr:chymotrypsin inhibitor-like [Anopheles stephensi]